jgi:GSH-dependent disulfide-bond oxidoreductase
MITLYGGPTPNTRKVSICLEEMGLPWSLTHIDILRGDQLTAEFLALNPNNKFPVIVDDEGPTPGPFVLWESGAILLYLAEKTGRFVPADPAGRAICHQWLMFQMSGVGPMIGQAAHFTAYAKDRHPYAIERYTNEVGRLLGVLEGRVETSAYLAGDSYTIADMATYPYVVRRVLAAPGQYPSLARWCAELAERAAVARGMEVAREFVRPETIEGGLSGLTDEQRSVLFGARQYAAR